MTNKAPVIQALEALRKLIVSENAHDDNSIGESYLLFEARKAEQDLQAWVDDAPMLIGFDKFKQHEGVRKKGSKGQWHGKICGWYSTSITPEGYAVESSKEAGSVQIYPASALELYNPSIEEQLEDLEIKRAKLMAEKVNRDYVRNKS